MAELLREAARGLYGSAHVAADRRGRFALFSPVGKPGPEMLYYVVPDGQGTRLELTFRWPAMPSHPAEARSMTDAVRHRVAAFKDLIENPDSPWTGGRATP